MKILKRILKGPHEDLERSLKIFERFSPGLVSKNQIKTIKALVFKVTKEIYNVRHLDTNFDAYAVDLSMVLTWAIRAQRLHGSDQEDMEFNIKIDGCPLGSELNVSFLQSMQQLLPPLIYGSK